MKRKVMDMTNGERIGKLPLVELLIKIRLENAICPLKAFYMRERKWEVLSRRCAEYGYYTTDGIEKGACIHCIADFLSEEEEG